MASCPLCRSRRFRELACVGDEEYATPGGPYLYRECLACLAVYLFDPPWRELSRIYPPNYYSVAPGKSLGILQSLKLRMESRFLKKLLGGIPGESLRVLDAGGGSGWMATAMRHADTRISQSFVLDLDECKRAPAEAAGHRFIKGRIESIGRSRRYHFICLINLIEHLKDPRKVLKALGACLSPGGLILVKTPNSDSLGRRLFEGGYWGGYHAPRHFVLFNRENFAALAASCGLEMAGFQYTQGAPQWAGSILSLLRRRGLIRVSPQRPMFEHPLAMPLMALSAAFDFARAPFGAKTEQMFIVLKPRVKKR
jgi:2-polyprenyl-3-methyl-5-hydroxy-6-metoxy-1,4-benzoquinol methylase